MILSEKSATFRDHALALANLDLLFLLGDFRRLGQMNAQYALVEFRFDILGFGFIGQLDRSAEGAIAAFDEMPVLVLAALVALGLLLALIVSMSSASVTSISFSSTPGSSAVTSMPSFPSATSIFGAVSPGP
jgi:hypothetical protein